MSTQLRINMLVPEPHVGAGGDVGLFRVAQHLAQFGHDCRVHVVPYIFMNEYSAEDVRAYIGEHFGTSGASYTKWDGNAEDADCTIATFWPTVADVLAIGNAGRRFYIVQDFEPWFYPDVPVNYEGAEQTYRAGLHCITLGAWLARVLRNEYGAVADHFDFAVDPQIYFPRDVQRPVHRRICFYARPTTPRRAYRVGLEAFRLVHERMPEVELVLFGSAELDPEPPFPFTNAGKLNEEQLATLFSSCDAGLVLSLSNPSFVPLEMLACRCAVVEIRSERFEGILAHDRDAWLVEQNPAAIADGILRLLNDQALRERLARTGFERTQRMSWRDSVRQIEAVLLRNYPGAES